MTTFNSREKAFEDKFAHEEALKFKARMKRNTLFASWAANALGKEKSEEEFYIRKLLEGAIQNSDEHYALHQVIQDIQNAGLSLSTHQIQRTFDECMSAAKEELKKA